MRLKRLLLKTTESNYIAVMMRIVMLILVLLCLCGLCVGFRLIGLRWRSHTFSMSNDDMGVPLTSLKEFEEDGEYISASICKFLDEEWIKQDIHQKLGEECKALYIKGRKEGGIHDLGEMLMEIGSELEKFDMVDAYVGPWDVANTVSDLLMARLGRYVRVVPLCHSYSI